MRESKFRELMADEFGAAYAVTVIRSHSITSLHATAERLLRDGVAPRLIWEGICTDFDIPEERRLGRDVHAKR